MPLKRKDFTVIDGHRLFVDHFDDWCFQKSREEARKVEFIKVSLFLEPTL